jgi:hypothetical protein
MASCNRATPAYSAEHATCSFANAGCTVTMTICSGVRLAAAQCGKACLTGSRHLDPAGCACGSRRSLEISSNEFSERKEFRTVERQSRTVCQVARASCP